MKGPRDERKDARDEPRATKSTGGKAGARAREFALRRGIQTPPDKPAKGREKKR